MIREQAEWSGAPAGRAAELIQRCSASPTLQGLANGSIYERLMFRHAVLALVEERINPVLREFNRMGVVVMPDAAASTKTALAAYKRALATIRGAPSGRGQWTREIAEIVDHLTWAVEAYRRTLVSRRGWTRHAMAYVLDWAWHLEWTRGTPIEHMGRRRLIVKLVAELVGGRALSHEEETTHKAALDAALRKQTERSKSRKACPGHARPALHWATTVRRSLVEEKLEPIPLGGTTLWFPDPAHEWCGKLDRQGISVTCHSDEESDTRFASRTLTAEWRAMLSALDSEAHARLEARDVAGAAVILHRLRFHIECWKAVEKTWPEAKATRDPRPAGRPA